MIRLEGPLRDHLEDPASDERVAKIEQEIRARRMTRGVRFPRLGLLVPVTAVAAGAFAFYLVTRAPAADGGRGTSGKEKMAAIVPPSRAAFGAVVSAEPEQALMWNHSGGDLMAFMLSAGHAAFDIPSDTGRRWEIDAELARVETVGARFTVTHRPDGVVVEVSRGPVKVWSKTTGTSKELGDGEKLEIRAEKRADLVEKAAVETTAVETTAVEKAAVEKAAVESSGPKKIAEPKVIDLWEVADAARARGDNERAVKVLAEIAKTQPSDARSGLASFIRARLLQDVLGRPAEAAQAIELAIRLGLAEDLRESARARLFSAHVAAHDQDSARRAAFEYLAHDPDGPHAREAKKLAGVETR